MNGALEVFRYFLRLGALGFGGPLALVAQMQTDLVLERQWMDPALFQRSFTLIKSMPGAVAFNTAVTLGRHRAGWKGGFAAAIGLILPAAILVLIFAAFYQEIRALSWAEDVLTGMQAAALALIAMAVRPLAGRQATRPAFWAIAALGGFLFWKDLVPEPVLILGAGIIAAIARRRPQALAGFVWFSADGDRLHDLFWICFKAGAFVFGTGVAIAPLLQQEFVERHGWLTLQEFLDALAIGQITPGPVLLTTTFLGYKTAGLLGAVLATTGVFLAGFLHMMTWFPKAVNWLSGRHWLEDFLFGALAMVVGTIVVTVIRLALVWRESPAPLLIVGVCMGLLWWSKWPSWKVIVLGAFLGPVVAML